MKILFCSVPFRPAVGGIETVSEILAERFKGVGHEVTLVTQTPCDESEHAGYRVVRKPTALQMMRLVAWADVVFHNNISLRFAWPQLLLRRPWVVAHHTWIAGGGLAARMKRRVLRHATHIAVSKAVAKSLPVPCTMVPNPYADHVFVPTEGGHREGQLVFLGRLVSDKGVHVLLDALALLAQCGKRVRLTVVGEGPEEASLRQQASALGLTGQVSFIGRRSGAALAAVLREHRVLVVPSVWEEPFGVVALEAMACGCVPLVTRSGGLPDAVGAAGVVVARDDSTALARGIDELVDNPQALSGCRAAAPAHLERHTRERVARAYLQVIEDAHRTHSTQSTATAV